MNSLTAAVLASLPLAMGVGSLISAWRLEPSAVLYCVAGLFMVWFAWYIWRVRG